MIISYEQLIVNDTYPIAHDVKLKEGGTWRAIPHDYPHWRIVRYHYDIWAEPDEDGVSLLDRILRKLVEMERKNNDRSKKSQ